MEEPVTYTLQPGFIYVNTQRVIIRTVVGSCVAVCLWDKKKHFGGMNHFLYPQIYETQKATAQYGNVAIKTLLKMMMQFDSDSHDLVAHIFGGGYQEHLPTTTMVGKQNSAVAQKCLQKEGIKIISQDIGGTMGRKILFDTFTGEIAVIKVHQIRATDWVKEVQ